MSLWKLFDVHLLYQGVVITMETAQQKFCVYTCVCVCTCMWVCFDLSVSWSEQLATPDCRPLQAILVDYRLARLV